MENIKKMLAEIGFACNQGNEYIEVLLHENGLSCRISEGEDGFCCIFIKSNVKKKGKLPEGVRDLLVLRNIMVNASNISNELDKYNNLIKKVSKVALSDNDIAYIQLLIICILVNKIVETSSMPTIVDVCNCMLGSVHNATGIEPYWRETGIEIVEQYSNMQRELSSNKYRVIAPTIKEYVFKEIKTAAAIYG